MRSCKARLARCTELEQLLAKSIETNAVLQATIQTLQNDLKHANNSITKAGDLNMREAELASRERALENTLLRTQLDAAQQNAEFAKSVAMGLVRNTEYRNTVFTSGSTPIARACGTGYDQVEQHPTSTNRTVHSTQEYACGYPGGCHKVLPNLHYTTRHH